MQNELFPGKADYTDLLCYQKSLIVYDGTFLFCSRFLKKGDRTIDQMVQAARSGKQNIVEGVLAWEVSNEAFLKLLGVARASQEELLEDYRDYLRTRRLELWDKDSRPALKVRQLGKSPEESFETYREYLEQRSDGTCANIMICLIHQCNYLLDQFLRTAGKQFIQNGGIREKMKQARLDYLRRNPREPGK